MSGDTPPSEPLNIFFSCAPEDMAMRETLERQLSVQKRLGWIACWHRDKIGVGQYSVQEISRYISQSPIILLLISPDFFASEECDIEVTLAYEQYKANRTRVVPILLRPVSWENLPFGERRLGDLQPAPKSKKPIHTWSNQGQAYYEVAQDIIAVVKQLLGKP